MNVVSEQEFLACVIKHLAKNPRLTLGSVVSMTRAFRKPRRIQARAVFELLEKFVDRGYIRRVAVDGRVAYTTCVADTLAERPKEKTEFESLSNTPHITTGVAAKIAEQAFAYGKIKQNVIKQEESFIYKPPTTPANTPEERREREKQRRAEHAQEMEKALATDPLEGLDDPEVNHGV